MGYGYYGIDMSYIVLVMPAILFSLWAQTKVNSTFSKYQRVRCYSGYTGAQIARRILDENGLSNVRTITIPAPMLSAFRTAFTPAIRSQQSELPLTKRVMPFSMRQATVLWDLETQSFR